MKLTLPPGDFKAYLFDCDGTIADSMPLHFVAWKQALAEHGATFTEQQHYGWGGMPIAAIIERLNREQGLQMPREEVEMRKEQLFYEFLPQIAAVPEVLEHIRASHGKLPFAVVSGSTRQSVTASLSALGLLNLFDTMVCAGDYTHAKPHPEPYLMAAERLGIPPANCLVFEDTEMGIQSATAAGMASVRVPQPWER